MQKYGLHGLTCVTKLAMGWVGLDFLRTAMGWVGLG